MRIGLVVEQLDPWRGGAETSTGQFIDHVLGAGIELDVFTRSRRPSFPGCTIHTLRVPQRPRSRSTADFLRQSAGAATAAGLDLIHAMVPCAAADLYEPRGGTVAETAQRNVAVRRSMAGRAIKSALLQLSPKQRVLLRAERTLLTRDPPPIVVALSSYVARQCQTHYGLNDDRVRVVFNGINPDDSAPQERARNRREIRATFGIDPNVYVLLLVAHNFKLKGLRQAIDAISKVDAANGTTPMLLVVGRGRPNVYKNQADRLGIGQRVHFVGTTERVPAFYHAADVLIHPTFYDPCSRVVLEALAAGLPCITTQWNGAAEIMADGVQGFVIDSPHNVQALADAIRRLSEPRERARFSAAALKLRPLLSMQSHAERILQLYRELAESKCR